MGFFAVFQLFNYKFSSLLLIQNRRKVLLIIHFANQYLKWKSIGIKVIGTIKCLILNSKEQNIIFFQEIIAN
jgi:hypothetical protein